MEGWAFVDGHIKEGEFIIITFISEFYGWVTRVNFVHELLEVFVGTCSDNEDIVNVSFPHVDV